MPSAVKRQTAEKVVIDARLHEAAYAEGKSVFRPMQVKFMKVIDVL